MVAIEARLSPLLELGGVDAPSLEGADGVVILD
jgi:hypothetical protein